MEPNPALRVVSWSDARIPVLRQIVPMVWVAPDRNPDPVEIAQRLARAPLGSRTIHVFHPMRVPGVVNPFDLSDPTLLFRRGSRVGNEHVAYYAGLFSAIHAAGGRVDRVVIDFEGGSLLWHFGEPRDRVRIMRLLLADRVSRSRMPEVVTTLEPEQFADSARAREAYIAFNQLAAEDRARAIDQMIIRPARAVFGDHLRSSNYNDLQPRFEVLDRNGWPMPSAASGTDDSPELYLLQDGNRYKQREKHPRWNRLIDCLNIVRSVAHRGRVSPWISVPGYQRLHQPPDADSFLWVSMLLHLLHTGVRDFILWNPISQPGVERATLMMDDAFHALAGSFGAGQGLLGDLPAIPLESNEIVTGDLKTTYDEFMDHELESSP